MKIYKFELPREDGIWDFSMPVIHSTLHVEVVNDIPYFWALVNPDKQTFYKIHVFWTGRELPDMENLIRIGTAVMNDGQYVCHYFREERL